jgi:bacillopeptidase F (M6 metalloprotease family)
VYGAAVSIMGEVTNRDKTVINHLRNRGTGRGQCKGEVVSLHDMKMYGGMEV